MQVASLRHLKQYNIFKRQTDKQTNWVIDTHTQRGGIAVISFYKKDENTQVFCKYDVPLLNMLQARNVEEKV